MTPIYDFKTSQRVGWQEVAVPKSRIVIVEGIYALTSRLRPLLDLRVSITGGVHFDLVKRVLRDIDRSGQTPDGIIQQVADTVYPMYKAFIEPDLKTAHLKVYNNFNPFSGFMEPTFILKVHNPCQVCPALGTLARCDCRLSAPSWIASPCVQQTPCRRTVADCVRGLLCAERQASA